MQDIDRKHAPKPLKKDKRIERLCSISDMSLSKMARMTGRDRGYLYRVASGEIVASKEWMKEFVSDLLLSPNSIHYVLNGRRPPTRGRAKLPSALERHMGIISGPYLHYKSNIVSLCVFLTASKKEPLFKEKQLTQYAIVLTDHDEFAVLTISQLGRIGNPILKKPSTREKSIGKQVEKCQLIEDVLPKIIQDVKVVLKKRLNRYLAWKRVGSFLFEQNTHIIKRFLRMTTFFRPSIGDEISKKTQNALKKPSFRMITNYSHAVTIAEMHLKMDTAFGPYPPKKEEEQPSSYHAMTPSYLKSDDASPMISESFDDFLFP